LLALLAAGLFPSASRAAPEPGLVYVHTVRGNTTTTGGQNASAPTQALAQADTFFVTGQQISVPLKSPLVLVLSNGAALALPEGGQLKLEEFAQEPVTDTAKQREEEPTRSNIRLNLATGALVLAGRTPVPTSNFTITTLLAQLRCLAKSVVVVADANALTVTVFDGTVSLSIPGTGFSETLQTGQTATLARSALAEKYPLKLSRITATQEHDFGAWLELAQWAAMRVDFSRAGDKLHPRQVVPETFTQQMSMDEPRYRQ
jgi:hypothetical protein